ncbi:M16 family metallopeptidase [Sediminicola sp. 1XM1-17]|uniref:M16 family metallopeptidase n=1 Tax=Sediminicola sp. 1XM1-17 TaxID=3127702 RepID=UPI003077A32D
MKHFDMAHLKNTMGTILFNSLFIFLIVFGTIESLAAQEKFQLPQYSKFTMSNGLTIYFMEQHEVPLIQLSAVFPAGAIYDPKEKSGLANATAAAMVLGTENYSKSKIEEQVDYVGASLYTWADKEAGYLSSSFMKRDQKKILEIVKDVLLHPIFPDAEWKKLQERKLVEIDQMKESPRASIRNYFDHFVFGGHPYGNSVVGNKTGIENITSKELADFYKNQYQPSKAAIAIVGDFDSKLMKKEIERLFGDWKQSSEPLLKLPDFSLSETPRVLLVNKEDANETTFLIGGKGISRNNPDYVAVQVINTILGGRFTSWLNDELRVNSGLTYGAGSRFNSFKNGGVFQISTFTATATTEQAIDLALETYKRLHTKGVDQKTLNSAKNYLKGQFPPEYETNGQLAILLTDMFLYNFDESFINTFTQKIDALNLENISALIDTYFPKDNLQFVLIGKGEEIKEIAKKYGDLEQLEILNDGF